MKKYSSLVFIYVKACVFPCGYENVNAGTLGCQRHWIPWRGAAWSRYWDQQNLGPSGKAESVLLLLSHLYIPGTLVLNNENLFPRENQ